MQGATAAIDPGGSAEESASAVEQLINNSCSSLDQVHHELELIRRGVVQEQQRRREREMQECEVQPQQQPQQQQLELILIIILYGADITIAIFINIL